MARRERAGLRASHDFCSVLARVSGQQWKRWNMTQNAWALGLYSYSAPHPGAEGFGKFYEQVLATYQELGIQPTYFAAEGPGYSGDLTRCGDPSQARLTQSGFAGVHGLSVAANPEGSKQPGYDAFATVGLSYVASVNETMLCMLMEERFAEFGGPQFEKILRSLVALRSWEFGHAVCQPIEKKPLFHVLGLDDGKLTPAEYKLLSAWYGSQPSDRVRKLRDVYPFYVVNDQQLNAPVGGGLTLRDFIKRDGRSSLQGLDASGLWLWRVDGDSLADIRARLTFSDVLIL